MCGGDDFVIVLMKCVLCPMRLERLIIAWLENEFVLCDAVRSMLVFISNDDDGDGPLLFALNGTFRRTAMGMCVL